ncbi:MAG: hypothetical protein B0D92_07390 [Spirochaeta sp. LUC14_002_19_P3]|nr:MAG: hypothetical protein B0D92_07390 [Spirochaeta sp. LUC14_002_19_P3]
MLAVSAAPPPRTGRVTLDTTALYAKDGQKWGLGSSAAAALLLCRFLLDTPESPPPREDIIAAALHTHRHFQNGLGSGYDIYTSAHGGAGLFTGGETPSWQPISPPSGIQCYLLRGPAPVSSARAVQRYTQWTGRARSSLLTEMDERVLHLSTLLTSGAPSAEVLSEFAALGTLGALIGDAIGVPARPLLPEGLGSDIPAGRRPGAAVKCLGAGDELALLLYQNGALTSGELALLDNLVKEGRAKREN